MIKKIIFLLLMICSIDNLPAQNDGARLLLSDSGRNVRLSPQVRIIERERSIPTIKMEAIQAFLNRPQLITEEEIEYAGSIIANIEQSLFSIKGSQIYVEGLDNEQVGNQYTIIRFGKIYRSPLEDDDNEILAYEAIYLGEAILKVADEPALLEVTTAIAEIRLGDRLLPLDKQAFHEDIHPHSPKMLEDAYIIAVVGDTSIISQYQIVVINKGIDDGMERGYLLAVLKGKGRFEETIEENRTVQKRRAGTVLVFRVFERVSYALVMSSHLQINLLDIVTVP